MLVSDPDLKYTGFVSCRITAVHGTANITIQGVHGVNCLLIILVPRLD